jgi:hypothetical protein
MIWTGELNRPFAFEADVAFYDTTLRDGEQTVGVVLDPEQKLEIARGLADAGVERIEAGFPRVSQEDYEAVRRIAEAGLPAEVWGFSRAVHADVEALVELGVQASVIESPISELKLRALGVSSEEPVQGFDAPTLIEEGYDVTITNWRGVVAPPDLSEEDQQAVIGMIEEMHGTQEWEDFIETNNFEDTFKTGEEFGAFIRKEDQRITQVLKDLGLTQ